MTEDDKVLEIGKILSEWNPLGAGETTVLDLDDYETEARDILWCVDSHGDKVRSAVTTVMQQAFNIELDESELDHYSKKIASLLDDEI